MKKKSIYTLKHDYIIEELSKICRGGRAREVAILIADSYLPYFIYDQNLTVKLSSKHIAEKYGVSFDTVGNAKQLLRKIGFMKLVSRSIPSGANARPAIWTINRDFYNVVYTDFFNPDVPQLTMEVAMSANDSFKRVGYLYSYLEARHGKGNAYRLKRLISSQSGMYRLTYNYLASEIVRRGL